MCCTYGEGSYEAKLEGVLVGSGGDFTSSTAHFFSVDATPPTSPPPTLSPVKAPSPTSSTESFELHVRTDSYASETSWTLAKDGVGYSNGGPYSTPNADQDPYTAELSAGNYVLTILDSYGDGMCCTYGEGSYEAKLEGVVVASGGEFTLSATHPFSVDAPPPTSPPPTLSPVKAPSPTLSPVKAPSPTLSPVKAPS